jgi:hypothetical protein
VGTPSDERKVLFLQLLLAHAMSSYILLFPQDSWPYFILSQIWDFPILRAMSPQEQAGSVIPRALGSISFASCFWQGYDRDNLRLHTRFKGQISLVHDILFRHGLRKKHRPENSSTAACLFAAPQKCLPSRYPSLQPWVNILYEYHSLIAVAYGSTLYTSRNCDGGH